MPKKDDKEPGLQLSGFPFQTKIENRLPKAGWDVADREFHWLDQKGSDQYLDIVARRHGFPGTIAGIECKKASGDLVFLRPKGGFLRHDQQDPIDADGTLSDPQESASGNARFLAFDPNSELWSIAVFGRLPPCYQSSFCVPRDKEGHLKASPDDRLLEKDLSLLVRGLDAYARFRRDRQFQLQYQGIFVPLLVTNAPLSVAIYDPEKDVDEETGRLSDSIVPQPVDCVRFSKSFPFSPHFHVGDRTVFVVRASALASFLEGLQGILKVRHITRLQAPDW